MIKKGLQVTKMTRVVSPLLRVDNEKKPVNLHFPDTCFKLTRALSEKKAVEEGAKFTQADGKERRGQKYSLFRPFPERFCREHHSYYRGKCSFPAFFIATFTNRTNSQSVLKALI